MFERLFRTVAAGKGLSRGRGLHRRDAWVTEADGYPGLRQAHRIGDHWKIEHRAIVL